MDSLPRIYDPAEWSRAGRGQELQFFATDADVQRWFDDLPEEHAPYAIWGSRLVEENGEHRRVTFSCSVDEWTDMLASVSPRTLLAITQFFLLSEALMPRLDVDNQDAQRANELAVLNGLVLVQHGAVRAGQRLASRIAVANKIKHRSTGEVVSLKDRLLVFNALRRMIESELCFATIHTFRDGHEEEDAAVKRMTVAAAELAATGFFERRAGRRLPR